MLFARRRRHTVAELSDKCRASLCVASVGCWADPSWEDLSYEDSLSFAVRTRRCERICTTNEGKTGGIVFHHEQAQTPTWPSKLFFCCEKAATGGKGGGTGVCPSDALLKRLEAEHPEFIRDCVEKGVKYVRAPAPQTTPHTKCHQSSVHHARGTGAASAREERSFCSGRYSSFMTDVQDTSKGVGRSWKSYFTVSTREEAEARMRELKYALLHLNCPTHSGRLALSLRSGIAASWSQTVQRSGSSCS